MAISSDLFMAILAMDAYNRGYNAGIGDHPSTGLTGSQIGNATIGIAQADTDISFFAQAYIWSGQTTISYRGTDDLIWDAVYGWGLGLGYPETPQADMAA